MLTVIARLQHALILKQNSSILARKLGKQKQLTRQGCKANHFQ